MKKNVIISILGKQTDQDGESEQIELTTPGTLARQGRDDWLLSYQETRLSGMEGTETTFHVRPDRIVLSRTGNVNSEMTFETGRKHLSAYEVEGGVVVVGVDTRSMAARLSDTGGSIDIHYVVDVENQATGENRFHISVKEPHPFVPASL